MHPAMQYACSLAGALPHEGSPTGIKQTDSVLLHEQGIIASVSPAPPLEPVHMAAPRLQLAGQLIPTSVGWPIIRSRLADLFV
jgi:hypothetical protein